MCGARRLFSAEECGLLMTVPPCPRCDGTDWCGEVDELAAPDSRERP
jgi:hypothetical protein